MEAKIYEYFIYCLEYIICRIWLLIYVQRISYVRAQKISLTQHSYLILMYYRCFHMLLYFWSRILHYLFKWYGILSQMVDAICPLVFDLFAHILQGVCECIACICIYCCHSIWFCLRSGAHLCFDSSCSFSSVSRL